MLIGLVACGPSENKDVTSIVNAPQPEANSTPKATRKSINVRGYNIKMQDILDTFETQFVTSPLKSPKSSVSVLSDGTKTYSFTSDNSDCVFESDGGDGVSYMRLEVRGRNVIATHATATIAVFFGPLKVFQGYGNMNPGQPGQVLFESMMNEARLGPTCTKQYGTVKFSLTSDNATGEKVVFTVIDDATQR